MNNEIPKPNLFMFSENKQNWIEIHQHRYPGRSLFLIVDTNGEITVQLIYRRTQQIIQDKNRECNTIIEQYSAELDETSKKFRQLFGIDPNA